VKRLKVAPWKFRRANAGVVSNALGRDADHDILFIDCVRFLTTDREKHCGADDSQDRDQQRQDALLESLNILSHRAA